MMSMKATNFVPDIYLAAKSKRKHILNMEKIIIAQYHDILHDDFVWNLSKGIDILKVIIMQIQLQILGTSILQMNAFSV